jgi:glutathione S-transferase
MLPPFWKGVLWAVRVAKMSFRWKYGNGKRIRFWENQCFGTCSLAIQFWKLYTIVNEHDISLREAWDDVEVVLRYFHQHFYKSSSLWFFVGEGLSLSDASFGWMWWTPRFMWFRPSERNTLRPWENGSYTIQVFAWHSVALSGLDCSNARCNFL